ncbi:hypothetical protein [Calothrix sp. NIES-2098]|uniref:hypothetical protein n=1 Tax=Calothrix sp. NIES-2098 TaxID=1954171 RepID=UPI000BBBA40D
MNPPVHWSVKGVEKENWNYAKNSFSTSFAAISHRLTEVRNNFCSSPLTRQQTKIAIALGHNLLIVIPNQQFYQSSAIINTEKDGYIARPTIKSVIYLNAIKAWDDFA